MKGFCEAYQIECELAEDNQHNTPCQYEVADCAGQEAYEQMMESTRNIWDDPSYY